MKQEISVPQLLQKLHCVTDSELNSLPEVKAFFNKTRLMTIDSPQRGLYLEIDNKLMKYYSLAYYSKWAWKNDTNYWIDKIVPNAPLNEKTPYLDNVCWLDTHFGFEHVLPGKYKFKLMHLAYESEIELILKVTVNDRVVYEEDYPDNKTISECNNFMKNKSEPEIYTQEMCEIDITDSDAKNEGAIVNVQFVGKNQSEFKENWYIHGGVLEQEYSYEQLVNPEGLAPGKSDSLKEDENNPEYKELVEKLKEMKERLERNKANYID